MTLAAVHAHDQVGRGRTHDGCPGYGPAQAASVEIDYCTHRLLTLAGVGVYVPVKKSHAQFDPIRLCASRQSDAVSQGGELATARCRLVHGEMTCNKVRHVKKAT